MNFEKLENCPDCRKELSQNEYDAQFCHTCKTSPFNFIKADRSSDIDKIIARRTITKGICAGDHQIEHRAMTNNIIPFKGITKHDLNPKTMFEAIIENDSPHHAFVICWPEDGSHPTFHSTTGDTAVVLYQLQRFIHKYFNVDFE